MKSNRGLFLKALDAAVSRYAMLKHPFYQLWSQGQLSQEILAEYAKQYYAHVQAFPTYVSAVHSHCDDLNTRQMLLENLIEEERGVENHPELWLRFAEGLGLQRQNVRQAPLLPSTKESVAALKRLTQGDDYLCGLAALYAYESQIPEVAQTKHEGLKAFYGIADERSVAFFAVHEQADVIHRQVERHILSKETGTEEKRARVLRAAEAGAKALWHFLDGVQSEYVGDSHCLTGARA